jgi:hypothetical protein
MAVGVLITQVSKNALDAPTTFFSRSACENFESFTETVPPDEKINKTEHKLEIRSQCNLNGEEVRSWSNTI